MVDVRLLLISVVCAACKREPSPPPHCEVAGGWELGAHDPTDRSTDIYITDRGSGAVDLDEDVRRDDGTHGWEVEHGRWIDASHLEFAPKNQCAVAASCDRIDCTSFSLIHHFCDLTGNWHVAHQTGTARITAHRDDLEIVGEHIPQLKGFRYSARDVLLHAPDGDVRCTIDEHCTRITCSTLEITR